MARDYYNGIAKILVGKTAREQIVPAHITPKRVYVNNRIYDRVTFKQITHRYLGQLKLELAGYRMSSEQYRVLNESGEGVVRRWIDANAETPQKYDAWFCYAETAANNAAKGEAITIELAQHVTFSKRPEVLKLEDSCFDWVPT